MIRINGNYYTFLSSTGVLIPIKYITALVTAAVKLKLWYVIGDRGMYVKIRIIGTDSQDSKATLCKLKKALSVIK